MSGKKRLFLAAGTLASVGAVVALATGVTFGLFSANAPATNSTFASGTVTLGAPAIDSNCAVTNMVPGDSATNACEFKVAYTGSAPAWIGIKLTNTGTGLYDGTANGLQYTISDGTNSYTTSGVLNNAGTILYVASDPGGLGAGTYDFTVSYSLPLGSPNTYQGLNSTLGMTVYAVQSANNGSAGTPGTPDATITWS